MPLAQPKPCSWPHDELSADEQRALGVELETYAGWMRRAAWVLSEHDAQLAQDLVQEARILLWRRGLAWIRESTPQYVRGAIEQRMRDVIKPAARRNDAEWIWEAFEGTGKGGEGREGRDAYSEPLQWRRCA